MLCEGVVMMQCCMWDVRISDIARRYCLVWHDCRCGTIVMWYKNVLGILWMYWCEKYCLAV